MENDPSEAPASVRDALHCTALTRAVDDVVGGQPQRPHRLEAEHGAPPVARAGEGLFWGGVVGESLLSRVRGLEAWPAHVCL